MSHLGLGEVENELVQTASPGLVGVALSSQFLQDNEGQVDGRLGEDNLLDVLLQPAEDGQHQLHVFTVDDGLLGHPAARLVLHQLKMNT